MNLVAKEILVSCDALDESEPVEEMDDGSDNTLSKESLPRGGRLLYLCRSPSSEAYDDLDSLHENTSVCKVGPEGCAMGMVPPPRVER